jgi:hypothetical protein
MPKPARICGSCAGWPAHATTEQEVAHQRLAADEDLVREHVGRADFEPSCGE